MDLKDFKVFISEEQIEKRLSELAKEIEKDYEGKDVLIIEDIIDTGRTMDFLVKYLKHKNPNSIKICTLADKPERRVVEVDADYIGFTVPNKFIIGYGFDYDNKYRNLPYIACLDE